MNIVHASLRIVLGSTLILLAAWNSFAQSVPRSLCFATQNLPPQLRAKSDELLLHVLDSEALYTVVGGLKPMSGGVPSLTISLDKPDLARAVEVRQIMETWSCGSDVRFALHHYARAFSGADPDAAPTRALAGVVFHRPSMARVIEEHKDLFAPLGITPNADPIEVLMAIEYNETPHRYRGYGLLFGYPEQAVEFFVAATPIPQTRNADPNTPVTASSGKLAPRKFVSIPTYARETGSFVYAVASDHVEDQSDTELRARAKSILESYKRRRALYIGEGKSGAAALLRDWFCKSDTDCQAANAALDQAAASSSPASPQ